METTETKKPSKHMQAALNQLTKQVEWFERKRAKLHDEVTVREKLIDELSTSIEYISEQIIKLKG
jgi:peptidoglycan hydrolase CwlO-like protein